MLKEGENIQVKIIEQIGKGTFGEVYWGKTIDDGDVALQWQYKITFHELTIFQVLKGKKYQHLIQVLAFEKIKGYLVLMELGKQIDIKSLSDKRETCLQMAKGDHPITKRK